MRVLRRFVRMPNRYKKQLGQCFLLVVGVRIGLWILPFRTLDRLLNRIHATGDRATDWPTVRRIVRGVRASSRVVPRATCLTQALATQAVLRMNGQASDLRFGVEKDEFQKFGAHAWIEVDGRIVIGGLPRHQRFAVLNPS